MSADERTTATDPSAGDGGGLVAGAEEEEGTSVRLQQSHRPPLGSTWERDPAASTL